VAGLVADPGWSGGDLSRLDLGRCPDRTVTALSPAYGPRGGALWSGRLKVIQRGSRRMLFDLQVDPHERNDLVSASPGMAAALAEPLQARLRSDVSGGGPDPIEDEELRRQLRALGYL